jgi:hypothetical protein
MASYVGAVSHPYDKIVGPFKDRTKSGALKHAMNVLLLDGDELCLDGRCRIRRANDTEAESIRHILSMSRGYMSKMRPLIWDYKTVHEGRQIRHEPLPSHRFHVVCHEDNGASAYQLERASVLASTPELHLGAGVHWSGPDGKISVPTGFGGLGPAAQRWFSEIEFGWHEERLPDHSITVSGRQELAFVYSKLWNDCGPPFGREPVRDGHIDLHEVLGNFLDLRDVPRRSPLKFLGTFAVLESLITRKPSPEDPYSSIIRQVTNKTQLVKNRFARSFLTPAYMESIAWKKLWSTMYELRSCYAHGRKPDFSKKPLMLLGTPKAALEMLTSLVKSVMRQVLEEPQLMADLRAV